MSVSKKHGVYRHFRGGQTAAASSRTPAGQPHRVLRISRHEADPLQIILAAQIQLRRLRRFESGHAADGREQQIRDIIAARDSLVARAVAGHKLSMTTTDQCFVP